MCHHRHLSNSLLEKKKVIAFFGVAHFHRLSTEKKGGQKNSREMKKIACPCWKRFYFMALTDVPMCCPAVAWCTKPAQEEKCSHTCTKLHCDTNTDTADNPEINWWNRNSGDLHSVWNAGTSITGLDISAVSVNNREVTWNCSWLHLSDTEKSRYCIYYTGSYNKAVITHLCRAILWNTSIQHASTCVPVCIQCHTDHFDSVSILTSWVQNLAVQYRIDYYLLALPSGQYYTLHRPFWVL